MLTKRILILLFVFVSFQIQAQVSPVYNVRIPHEDSTFKVTIPAYTLLLSVETDSVYELLVGVQASEKISSLTKGTDYLTLGWAGEGDNLGNHIATMDLDLSSFDVKDVDSLFSTNLELTENFNMSASSSTSGQLKWNDATMFHTYSVGVPNIFIGASVGNYSGTGTDNYIIGNSSLNSSWTTGTSNIGIGYRVFQDLTTGYRNIAFGHQSGIDLTDGFQNIYLGYKAGFKSIHSSDNIALGYYAMYEDTSGTQNIAIGIQALQQNKSGAENIAIGQGALLNNTTGKVNIGLGEYTGYSANADSCIYIGDKAGYYNISSSRLFIEQSDADSTGALIYGNFINKRLTINNYLRIKPVSSFIGTPQDGDLHYDSDVDSLYLYADSKWQALNASGGVGSETDPVWVNDSVEYLHKGDTTNFVATHKWVEDQGYISITNNIDNYMLTATGGGSINGESDVTYDGDTLEVNGMFKSTNFDWDDATYGSLLLGTYNGLLNINGVTYMGIGAGYNVTAGDYGTYLGASAGASSSSEANNTYVGYSSGYNGDGTSNTAIGHYSAFDNIGDANTMIGTQSGWLSEGDHNIFLGNNSGWNNDGSRNMGLGDGACEASTGDSNIFIGYNAGYDGTHKISIGLGMAALQENTGNNVIALGFHAGYQNSTSNQFIVKQSNINSTPLIQGDLLTNILTLQYLKINPLSSPPGSPAEGQIYYDSDEDTLRVYANGSWQALNGGGGGSPSIPYWEETGTNTIQIAESNDTALFNADDVLKFDNGSYVTTMQAGSVTAFDITNSSSGILQIVSDNFTLRGYNESGSKTYSIGRLTDTDDVTYLRSDRTEADDEFHFNDTVYYIIPPHITLGATDSVMVWDSGTGIMGTSSVSSLGDNLGNHIVTQALDFGTDQSIYDADTIYTQPPQMNPFISEYLKVLVLDTTIKNRQTPHIAYVSPAQLIYNQDVRDSITDYLDNQGYLTSESDPDFHSEVRDTIIQFVADSGVVYADGVNVSGQIAIFTGQQSVIGDTAILYNPVTGIFRLDQNITEPQIQIKNDGGTGGATFRMTDGTTADWKFKTGSSGFKIRDQKNSLDVLVIENDAAANTVYIDADGEVGIGTATPGYNLDVTGTLRVTTSTTSGKVIHPTVSNALSDQDWEGDAYYFPYDQSVETPDIAFGDLLYINSSDRVALADADAASTMICIGMALEAKTTGSGSILVLTRGLVRNTSWSITSLTSQYPLYVSTTAGDMTVTAPSGDGDQVQVVGMCVDSSTETIFFNPDYTVVEVVIP